MIGLTRREDAWTAYQYDAACSFLGLWLDNRLAETEKRGKKMVPKYTLEKLIADPMDEAVPRNVTQFRPVSAAMVGKKL